MTDILETDVREEVQTQRTKCPFYGFFYHEGLFMDQRGNQCPLHTSSYAPCQMEMDNQQPDWEACPAHSGKTVPAILRLLDTARIFPTEFHPESESEWEGIPLQKWYDYIIHGKEMDSQRSKEISGLRRLLDRFGQ